MLNERRRLLRSPLLRGVSTVAIANVLFLLLVLFGQGDRCISLDRVRTAFAAGELRTRDFLWNDARRGWFQFDDCNALQMLINPDPSRLDRALAPKVYQENEDWEGQCRVLRFLVEEWVDPQKLFAMRYSRYWHGYNVIAGLGLELVELRDLRRLLSAGVWISMALFALASWRSGPRVRRTGLIIAVAAATVWAVPYFAPGLTQGPGDALLFLALAGVAAWPRMTSDPRVLVPYAAGFGAAAVFLEMLTGKLPTAIAWLAAMTLAAARDERPAGERAPRAVVIALTAFVFGALATVAAKLILARVLSEPEAGSAFAARLAQYLKVPEYGDFGPSWVPPSFAKLPGILLPFARLFYKSPMLTYGKVRAGYLLAAAGGLAWLAAVVSGWRERRTERGRDRLLIAGAALVPAVWVCLLPTHTYIHATFMVRMLVVPITLGPIALLWPREPRSAPASVSAR